MAKWTYWRQPIEGNYRIREEVDGGLNHRIIDFVDTEDEARRLCDEHNDAVGGTRDRGSSDLQKSTTD